MFVLDDLDPADIAAFNAETDPPRPPVVFLLTLPNGQDVTQLSQVNNATTVHLSADDSDVKRIERRVKAAYEAALAGDGRLQWQDRGWWLIWPAALLMLVWFRRGWTMRWAIVAMLGLMMPGAARADGWRDWFATPDQQGQIAYDNKDYARAGALFQDPFRRGHAMMKAGQYAEAAEVLARVDTAEAAFAQAYAHVRNREYRPAIAAYEVALQRRPDFPEAAANLEITRAILAYVEDARIGADEVVYDNEDARGADTQVKAPAEDSGPLTADQWMSSIDTDMGDFLRSRFLLDSAGADK